MDRREFLSLPAALAFGAAALRELPGVPDLTGPVTIDVAAIDRDRILRAARAYLDQAPVTITATSSPRSAGGPHDYFSEGDYWWPDPNNPGGPYVQRDGMTNPDNFVAHRLALIRLGVQVPALAAAWLATKEARFAEHAARHLRAWFIDEPTRMNPNLKHAQAIHGRFTGRGTGIIDTLHLVEVVRAATVIDPAGALSRQERDRLNRWFAEYLVWLTTDQYGKDERDAKNNHGTCWVMQVAEFARFTGDATLSRFCRERFTNVLVPTQIASDGSFPLELQRTKPYGYSLFNLDAMATVCRILSTKDDNLWIFALPDGRGMGKAMTFMFPFIADKRSWTRPPDVMYFDGWPVRHPSLLFAGLALERPQYLELWRRLDPDPTTDEIIRNYPIRQPALWIL